MFCGNKKDLDKIMPYVSKDLQQALQYIKTTDFTKLANGEYEISGQDIFARVNTYVTEDKKIKKAESHNDYIDVQYLGAGEETIYFIPKADTHVISEDYSKDRDLLFYENIEEKDRVVLHAGDFAIFFPWELHRPGCFANNCPSNVQKIVVKVRYK